MDTRTKDSCITTIVHVAIFFILGTVAWACAFMVSILAKLPVWGWQETLLVMAFGFGWVLATYLCFVTAVSFKDSWSSIWDTKVQSVALDR